MRAQAHWLYPSGRGRMSLLAVLVFSMLLVPFATSAANLPGLKVLAKIR